jgi:hypothetical protein
MTPMSLYLNLAPSRTVSMIANSNVLKICDMYYPISVLDLVSWVRIAVLMNVYLGLGNSGGSGFWNEGYMSQGGGMEGLVYEQPEDNVDGSCHSKEGSK